MRNIKKIFASMFVLAVCVSMAAADALWGIRAKKNNAAASEWNQVVKALKQVDMNYPLKANWDAAKVGSFYLVVGSGEQKRALEEAVAKLQKNELLTAYNFVLADLRPTETKEVTVSFKPIVISSKLIGKASVRVPYSVSDDAAPNLTKGDFKIDGSAPLAMKNKELIKTVAVGKHSVAVSAQKQTEDNYKKYLWKYKGNYDFTIKDSDVILEISADEAMKRYNFIFPTVAGNPNWQYSQNKFRVNIDIPVSKVDDYIKNIKDAPNEYVKFLENECGAELITESVSAGYQDGEAALHTTVVSVPVYVSSVGKLQIQILGVKSPVYEIKPVSYAFPAQKSLKIDKSKKKVTVEIDVTGGDVFVRHTDIKFATNTCGAKASGASYSRGKMTLTISVSKAGEFQFDGSSFPLLKNSKGRVRPTYKFTKSDLGLK